MAVRSCTELPVALRSHSVASKRGNETTSFHVATNEVVVRRGDAAQSSVPRRWPWIAVEVNRYMPKLIALNLVNCARVPRADGK
eukprot:2822249-Pyramimonas_sp.AAC.1